MTLGDIPISTREAPQHQIGSSSKLPLLLPTLQTHRAPLHHNTHDLEERIRRRHGRMLGIGIICGGHLDDIRRHEVDPVEAAEDGAEFAGGPAACFGGAGGGGIYNGKDSGLGKGTIERMSRESRRGGQMWIR